jgi:hypothetical protein
LFVRLSKEDNPLLLSTTPTPPSSMIRFLKPVFGIRSHLLAVRNTHRCFSSSVLRNSVKFHQKHLFLCLGHSQWPKKLDEIASVAKIQEVLTQTGNKNLKLTVCDEASSGVDGYDILAFPDCIRIKNQRLDTLPKVLDALVEGTADMSKFEKLDRKYFFICCHGAVDERCGMRGPALVSSFLTFLEQRKSQFPNLNQIDVRKCSHIGGHQFAANVILFPHGDWFGMVQPDHIPDLVSYALGDEATFQNRLGAIWRGRIGKTPEEIEDLAKTLFGSSKKD